MQDIFDMKLKMSSELAEKICPTCNSKFKQTSPRQIYCCKRCRPAAYISKKIAKLMNKPIETKEVLCLGCSKKFAQSHAKQKYCSVACRPSTFKKQDKVIADCGYCKQEFKLLSPNQKFCSTECRTKSKQLPLLLVNCVECNKTFRQNNWKQIFCSSKCRNDQTNKKAFRIPTSLTDDQRQQVIDLINSFDIERRDKRSPIEA